MKALILPLALLFGPAQANCETRVEISLAETQRQALAFSPELKAAHEQENAARESMLAAQADRYPRLTFDGNYKYVSRIPEISLANGSAMKLGDYNTYSLGPTLSWRLWDNGAISSSGLALEAGYRAKKEQRLALEKRLRLNARLAYVRAQAANEKARLLADGLKISQSQYGDISASVRAGSKNRIDELVAHRDVLARTNQLSRARAELSSALLELAALTGTQAGYSFDLPFPDNGTLPGEVPEASERIMLEAFDALLKQMPSDSVPDVASPSLRTLEETALSLKLASDALEAQRGPKLLFSARSSLDFPNGPQLYAFGQNSAGVTLSMPLFEKGKTSSQAGEKLALARAGTQTRAQLEQDIRRDWGKAQNQLSALFYQQTVNTAAIAEAQDLAALMYRAYRDGRYTYFDVESANLRTLEAQLQAADTAAQILAQQALLASLSSGEEK
ncbi:MAG: TolC family protein [Elusimicrobia bacterium]|nr:TolC family protein [Elusimicrobiota bacterium]